MGRSCAGTRSTGQAASLLLLFLVMLVQNFSYPAISPGANATASSSDDPSFTFTVSGDLGATALSNASYREILHQGAVFHLALGDLSYNETVPEESFCGLVNSILGPSFPFEVVSGNHEDGGDPYDDGLIDNFARCLPDRLGSFGNYGKEYYFDYPSGTSPLARIILISPHLNFRYAGPYSYSNETRHFAWLLNRIDEARSRGIPWVVVGMHKVCVTLGDKECDIGRDLVKLLLQKRVDLILQAHEHNYQRTKQLRCLPTSETDGLVQVYYDPSCVASSDPDRYIQGSGTTTVISGVFGGGEMTPIDGTSPLAGYFVRAMGALVSEQDDSINGTVYGSDHSGVGTGLVKYTVHPDRLEARFVMTTPLANPTAPFADNFTILRLVEGQQANGFVVWLTQRPSLILGSGIVALTVTFLFVSFQKRRRNTLSHT